MRQDPAWSSGWLKKLSSLRDQGGEIYFILIYNEIWNHNKEVMTTNTVRELETLPQRHFIRPCYLFLCVAARRPHWTQLLCTWSWIQSTWRPPRCFHSAAVLFRAELTTVSFGRHAFPNIILEVFSLYQFFNTESSRWTDYGNKSPLSPSESAVAAFALEKDNEIHGNKHDVVTLEKLNIKYLKFLWSEIKEPIWIHHLII